MSARSAGSTPVAVPAADRRVVLVGANPAVQLYDGDRITAYASVWRVDWSTHGRGHALVLWTDDTVRVIGESPDLARWLERAFVRFFPEVRGLPWPEPDIETASVAVDLDLTRGLHARAADIDVRVTGVLDRRTYGTDDFDLAGRPHSLSLVAAPCSDASIHIGTRRLRGVPRVDGRPERPASTCFLTEAEVWRC